MSLSFRKFHRSLKTLRAFATGRRNVHLLHIRKTGGTALKHVLDHHGFTPGFAIHTHPHRIGLMHIPRGHAVMFVIRDPVKRFVSGFQSRLRMGAPVNHIPWSPGEARAFATFPDPNSLALSLATGHPMHVHATQAMNAISHLRSSYAEWFGSLELLGEREKDIIFIGRTEALDDEFPALAGFLGLPHGLSLPSDPKLAHRAGPSDSRASSLTPEAVEQVRAWYAADYELLSFCEQWRDRQGGPVVST